MQLSKFRTLVAGAFFGVLYPDLVWRLSLERLPNLPRLAASISYVAITHRVYGDLKNCILVTEILFHFFLVQMYFFFFYNQARGL